MFQIYICNFLSNISSKNEFSFLYFNQNFRQQPANFPQIFNNINLLVENLLMLQKIYQPEKEKV